MSGLSEQLKGVNADPPSEPEDDQQDEVVVDEPEDEPQGEDEGEQNKDGRTPENVYREVSRKLEKEREDNRKFQEGLLNKVAQMNEQLVQALGSLKQPDTQKRTLDDFSIDELKAHRNAMADDDPQKAQLDTEIARRIVNDTIDQKVSELTTRQTFDMERKTAGEQAVQRYPDLANESSEFYAKVDRKIRSMSPTYKANNPRVVLDVANEVALSEGIAAKTVIRAPGRPGANRRDSKKPAPQAKEEYVMSKDEAEKIAKKLESALGKPFTKEQIDKIRKGHKEYHDYWKSGPVK